MQKSSPSLTERENNGVKTALVAPITIPTKGKSVAPLEKSAKTSVPKYLLIKNWSVELINVPHIEATKSGKANLNIAR